MQRRAQEKEGNIREKKKKKVKTREKPKKKSKRTKRKKGKRSKEKKQTSIVCNQITIFFSFFRFHITFTDFICSKNNSNNKYKTT